MSKAKFFALVASVAAVSFGSTASLAQQPPPQSPNMTFFITSSGPSKGADLGGLEGADRQCQTLAQAAGAGNKTWRAYLSTQGTGGAQAVNARDRIGRGPWQNFKGEVIAQNVDDLHGDNNKLGMQVSLTERGTLVAGVGYTPNAHDVLTGSQMDGRAFPAGEDRTCRNWTSSTQGAAMVGHSDRKGLRDDALKRKSQRDFLTSEFLRPRWPGRVSANGTKSYSPMPCRTRNTADASPALVTRCGRFGGTEYVSPAVSRTSSLGPWRKMRMAPLTT